MAASLSLRSLHLWEVLVLTLITLSLALAQDENDQFFYNDFHGANLHMDGTGYVLYNGLLVLSSRFSGQAKTGHAFYPFPIKFNLSSSQPFSFSTNFVFAIVPEYSGLSGHGIAFVISPSMDLSKALPFQYMGLFNASNIGSPENHIFAVELDTAQTPEFGDINDNHVGIDVNSVRSNESAPATYFSDAEGKNTSLNLESGDPIQIWIDYSSREKLLNVTIAPVTLPKKPTRPLLSTRLDLSQILLDTMYVGFSASTGALVGYHYILGWSFNISGQAQNLIVSKLPEIRELPTREDADSPKANDEPRLLIIVLTVSVVVVLMTISGAIYVVRKQKYEEIYEEWEREYGPQRFSYKTLYKATKGFKDRELIGKGGFGKVYKGILPSNDLEIAVKRVSHNSEQRMKEFVAEIVSMGKLRHRNLVRLHGYCRRKGELLLVYDYMPNESLDKILYSNASSKLNWFQRFQIIRGIASGLFYLHEEWEQVVVHRDIKPGNVLLDADLNGKLGDFGLARLYDHGSDPETTILAGTLAYMAPELHRTGKGTTSSDVFAFGVSMLEVACGRRRIERQCLPEQANLVDWVIDCWDKGAILDASDPKLEGLFAQEQMELVLKLGLFCSHPNPAARPSMRQVMQYLDGDVKLPDIPPDSTVRAVFSASNEASHIVMPFSSLLENSSPATISTASILTVGR
ncbi:hypothetical protein ACOSP7_024931 [Xanthoceras sorbifolium]